MSKADSAARAELPGVLAPPDVLGQANQDGADLAVQWRRLGRAATAVAVLTAPVVYVLLREEAEFAVWPSLLLTLVTVAATRGLVDVLTRRLIPWPNLFGAEPRLLQEDVVSRRRAWYWSRRWRLVTYIALFLGIFCAIDFLRGDAVDPIGTLSWMWDGFVGALPLMAQYAIIGVPLILVNFLILFGPLLIMNIQQIKGYEPGDADWGVKLEHVRGQTEAKREITRVVSLWQSGEEFEKAGGKRERGLLFLGPPGTGKTMLAKALATGFNCPFVSIPGSGFQATFMGVDVIVVRYMARKAKKLAAKWGGQCIVFIDEIDAVGMRRSALGAGGGMGGFSRPQSIHDYMFHGPMGALNPTGDMVLDSAPWRERMLAQRAEDERPAPSRVQRLNDGIRNFMMPGMGGQGGGLALNTLLVVMDGIDDPPFMKKFWTNRTNTILDALYIVPQKLGKARLRLARPKPARTQIYFIGACNVPIEALDPALTRPGRMGRHIRFRTPMLDDRKDIFDFYINKVSHEEDLDGERRRDEVARITGGYSPAMIEQVCSMALTYAHHDGRSRFGWGDLVEAMTTVEAGVAIGVEYVEGETRATAIHEAGHAAASHMYMKDAESTRLSIRMRGGSLGHHKARDRDERFAHFRSEMFGNLVWGLGACAAEEIFYGENTTGVSGDMQSATTLACLMAGIWAMQPERIDFGNRYRSQAEEDAAREKIMKRFQDIGDTLLSRGAGGSQMQGDPIAVCLGDPNKRRTAAQMLGQAYYTAYCFIAQNRKGVEGIAETLIERRELHGDEVIELLRDANLEAARLDYFEERTWPRV
jgi:ATP-dependent Zn protease